MNPDPNGVGGLCRLRCHSYRNPAACCAAKRGLCTDSDCDVRSGAYTGRWLSRPDPMPKVRVPRPTECSAWATPCSAYVNAGACCASKPTMCYDEACIGGRFVQNPNVVRLGGTRFAPPRVPRPPPGCPRAPPCHQMADPEECCYDKNPGCDPYCDAVRNARANAATNFSTNPKTGWWTVNGCRMTLPCQTMPDRDGCCMSKNPGCDPYCDAVRAQARGVSDWGARDFGYAHEEWTAFSPMGPGYFAPIL